MDIHELGTVFRTNFERCVFCSNRLRPLREGERQIGFDIEPFPHSADEERYLRALAEIFPDRDGVKDLCVHYPRVWIRFMETKRREFGRSLRLKSTKIGSKRVDILADLFLEEGSFHSSRVQQLTDEELEEL